MNKPVSTSQVFDIREIFPYLANFHNQKFVISADINLLLSQNSSLLEDIVLLAVCGIRIILIPDELKLVTNLSNSTDKNQIAINEKSWNMLYQQLAMRHFQIIANLNLTLRKYQSEKISIASNIYIRAKPRGVANGIDLGRNGKVRGIDTAVLEHDLLAKQIILIPAISPSPTGKLYWLAVEELAENLAIALEVNKWIVIAKSTISSFFSNELLAFFNQQQYLKGKNLKNNIPSEITIDQLKDTLQHIKSSLPLFDSIISTINNGVERVNIIAYDEDLNRNNLLQELFTHKGCGTVISTHSLDVFRKATTDDVGGIWSIIYPLEENGFLRPRSTADIEKLINSFFVITHDGLIIATAALIPIKDQKNAAEFAAFAVAPVHQKRGIGKKLLAEVLLFAKHQKINKIYLLTIHAYEWFKENGFQFVKEKNLPHSKQLEYDQCRKAKIMLKKL